jgi:hypothetical protein
MEQNKAKTTIIVAAIVALAVGMGGGYLIGKGMNSDDTMSMNSSNASSMTAKSAQLGVTLDGLLREHVSTSLTVTRNIVDGVSDEKMKGAEAAQTANAVAIAKAVGGIYGEDAQTAITTPFVAHITNSNKYAMAVATDDMSAQETSLAALQANLQQVADVFHSVIPSLSSDTLYGALNAHEGLLNESIKEYKAGNFEKSYMLESDALTQISGGATALSQGIVVAKPDMFK